VALAEGAAVSLVSASRPPGIPAEIEILPSAEPALEWADYVAVDAPVEALAALAELHLEEKALGKMVQVLVAGPMPCGFGVCGACAVPARRGWKLACVDGPVFDGAELWRR
jgi:dihydroorotate dehydrogenase electron transfer subunit